MGLNTKRDIKEEVSNWPVSQVLQAFLKTAVQHNLPVVFYQCPNTKQLKTILGSRIISDYRLTIENPAEGFIFSPFNNFSNTHSYFVPADIAFEYEGDKGQIAWTRDPGISPIIKRFREHLNSHANPIDLPAFYDGVEQQNKLLSYPNYYQSVDKAMKAIQNESFKKVVLARKKDIPLSQAIDPVDFFLRMTRKYPRAFVSLVSLPDVGTWLGSSPETLLKIDDEKLQTVALAGTKTIDQAGKYDVWTQKEYEEQEFVVQNIHDSFAEAGINNYATDGPETIQAGSLIHLKTIFEASWQQDILHKATRLLEQIHPTSAVCGTPKSEAYRFIQEHEPFSREFYAGYLGTTNINSTLDLYVNIRCARLFHDHISLFAGSGITAGSKAELENQEIQLKFNTIEKVIEELYQHGSEVLTSSWQQTGQ